MRGVAQQHHCARLYGFNNGFGGELFFLGQIGEVFVQQAAQSGILRTKRCRHGCASRVATQGAKKATSSGTASWPRLPYGSANCVRFIGSGFIPLSAAKPYDPRLP